MSPVSAGRIRAATNRARALRWAHSSDDTPRCRSAHLQAYVIAFQVSDMTNSRSAGVVTQALKAVDRTALVRVDMVTLTVEIEPGKASARQFSDAIKRAGYSPVAA